MARPELKIEYSSRMQKAWDSTRERVGRAGYTLADTKDFLTTLIDSDPLTRKAFRRMHIDPLLVRDHLQAGVFDVSEELGQKEPKECGQTLDLQMADEIAKESVRRRAQKNESDVGIVDSADYLPWLVLGGTAALLALSSMIIDPGDKKKIFNPDQFEATVKQLGERRDSLREVFASRMRRSRT